MYNKNYEKWNVLKQKINARLYRNTLRVGEVRWINFGVNVGSEIDGKGEQFLRPGLILHTFNDDLALVVPLTSKVKKLPGYLPFFVRNRDNALCIHQLKVISQNRILHRLERISDSRLASVRRSVVSFFNLTTRASMPHIHDAIDFTVTCMILHPSEPKVLLINHKLLNMWLPVGGHIELNEDPDEACAREVVEECGLSIEMLSRKHTGDYGSTRALYIPDSVDIHPFGENTTHRHVNFGYHARATSAEPQLAPEEHTDIKWFSADELSDPTLTIKPIIRDYALEFLQKYS